MLKLLSILLIALFITSCNTSTILIEDKRPTKLEELPSSTILQIPIPVRQKGYKNFKTTLITNELELDDFIKKVHNTQDWSKKSKELFIDSLMLEPIDFKQYNLLLYRLSRASNATILAVDVPVGDKKRVIIKLGKEPKTTESLNIAHFALAYRVDKSVEEIIFDDGTKKESIKNSKSEIKDKKEVPASCLEWYDGCNDCGRVGPDGDVVCTERYCVRHGAFRCTKWK